jgi:hypothetical protein
MHPSHQRTAPVRSIVPHLLPQRIVQAAGRPTVSGGFVDNYQTVSVATGRRVGASIPAPRSKAVRSSLELLRPHTPWVAVVLLLALIGIGVWRGIPKSRSNHGVETVPVQIKVLLNQKPAPGAWLTLTPVQRLEQTPATESEVASEMQSVGRGQLGDDSVCTPRLSDDRAGLPAGEYIASLTWCKVEVKDGETVAGPDRVPQIFRSPSTSTLRVHVAEGSNSLVTLQVVDPKVRARQMSYDHESMIPH